METAGTVSSDYLEKCITFLLEEFFADARESPLVIDLPPNLDDGENRRPVTYKFELVTISPGGIMRSSSIYWSYVACLFEHPQRLCNALVALSIAIDSLSAGFAVWGIGKHGKNAYEPILWQELFGSDGDRKRAEIEEDRAVCIRERKKAERKVAQQRALRAEEAA
ncbi:MAG: hypothetical protein LBB14_02230 [Puniceicoccales bacterium]|nr:hypothetical protein [Puniceicoccales bacterium]